MRGYASVIVSVIREAWKSIHPDCINYCCFRLPCEYPLCVKVDRSIARISPSFKLQRASLVQYSRGKKRKKKTIELVNLLQSKDSWEGSFKRSGGRNYYDYIWRKTPFPPLHMAVFHPFVPPPPWNVHYVVRFFFKSTLSPPSRINFDFERGSGTIDRE